MRDDSVSVEHLDREWSRRIAAEERVNELLAEQARLKMRMAYAELVLRAISSATHRNTAADDIEALLTEHKREYPEAWT